MPHFLEQLISPMGAIILGIISNVITAVIAFARGEWRANRDMRKVPAFWRGFESDCCIVGVRRDGDHWIGGLFSVHTSHCITLISSYLQKFTSSEIKVIYLDASNSRHDPRKPSEATMDDIESHNLIMICGPGLNPITKKFFSDLQKSMTIHHIAPKNEEESHCIVDTESNLIYSTIEDSSSGAIPTALEYGILVKCQHPYNNSKQVIVISALRGYSSWSIAKLITDNHFLEDNVLFNSSEQIECLVESESIKGTVQKINPIIIRSLKTSSDST